MRRAWILPTAGAALVGTATILGLVLFRKNGFFELTLPELTIWLFVVGPLTAAFLGLLFVEMRAPSAKRRTRFFLFGLFGGACGLIAGCGTDAEPVTIADTQEISFASGNTARSLASAASSSSTS